MELRGGGGGGGGAKLSLVPSPSLIVCREARSALHAGKKKGPGIYCLRMLDFMKHRDHSRI